jgi:hypothetical protein
LQENIRKNSEARLKVVLDVEHKYDRDTSITEAQYAKMRSRAEAPYQKKQDAYVAAIERNLAVLEKAQQSRSEHPMLHNHEYAIEWTKRYLKHGLRGDHTLPKRYTTGNA